MARRRKSASGNKNHAVTADKHFAKPQPPPAPESVPRHVTSAEDRNLEKDKTRKKRAEKTNRTEEDVAPQEKEMEIVFWTPERNATLLELLNNLNEEMERARKLFAPQTWFNQAELSKDRDDSDMAPAGIHIAPPTTWPPPAVPSFQSALDSINKGIKLVNQSGDQLLQLKVPSFETGVSTNEDTQVSTSQLEQPPAASKKLTKKSRSTPKTSPHFTTDPFEIQPTPPGLNFELGERGYGLIQERIVNSLYAGVLQTILWNQTTAKAARPVLFKLLTVYPKPELLAVADLDEVRDVIGCLGLQNRRAAILIKVAQTWVAAPPCPTRRYAKRHYPLQGDNVDVRDGELLEEDGGRLRICLALEPMRWIRTEFSFGTR